MILYVKHIDKEGPVTLGTFFAEQKMSSQTIELWRGDALPDDISGYQAIVVLGGPMNVYEEDQYPFLRAEHAFIQKVVQQRIPYLGICLGAQLLAKACGARVGKSPEKEIGFCDLLLTPAGKKDFLFRGLDDKMRVFQWHEDSFAIPPGSENLASSSGCPQQAFRVGPCAYGLQFHIEISEQTIREWTESPSAKEQQRLLAYRQTMLAEYQQIRNSFNRVAERVYGNFLQIMTEARRSSAVSS